MAAPMHNTGILRIMIIVFMTLSACFSFVQPVHSQLNGTTLPLTVLQSGGGAMPVLSESGRFQTSIIIGSGIGVGINHAQVTGILPQLYSSGKIGMEISLLKYVRFRLEMSTFTYSHSAMSATGLLYRSREGFGIQGQAGFMPAFPPRRTGGGFLLGYGLTTSRDSGTHLVSAHPTASVTAFMAWKRNDMLETRVLLPLEYSFRNEAPVFSASVACEIAIPVSGSTSHQRQTDGKVHNGN